MENKGQWGIKILVEISEGKIQQEFTIQLPVMLSKHSALLKCSKQTQGSCKSWVDTALDYKRLMPFWRGCWNADALSEISQTALDACVTGQLYNSHGQMYAFVNAG